jgi:hypothetical protein
MFSAFLVIVNSTSNLIHLLDAFLEVFGQFWMKGSLANVGHRIPVSLQVLLLCWRGENLLYTLSVASQMNTATTTYMIIN